MSGGNGGISNDSKNGAKLGRDEPRARLEA